MTYKNGKDFLPTELLDQIQKYVQGEIIYIPTNAERRAGWGESNGTRKKIHIRNIEIIDLYRSGLSVIEIGKQYHLSEHSIRKVVCRKDLKEAFRDKKGLDRIAR